jgi:hypothetical protein
MKPLSKWSRKQYEKAGKLVSASGDLGLPPEKVERARAGMAEFEQDERDGWVAPEEHVPKEPIYPTQQTMADRPPEPAYPRDEGHYKSGVRGELLAGPRTEVALTPDTTTVDEMAEQLGRKRAGYDLTGKLQNASKMRHLYSSPIYRAPGEEAGQGIATDIVRKQPFIYDEPSVEEMARYLQKSMENVDSEQYRAHWRRALTQLTDKGDRSEIYKEMADRRWMEAKRVFQRNGASIVRAAHIGQEEEEGLLNYLSTQGMSAMESFAGGLDTGITLGLGREAVATIGGNRIHGEKTAKALAQLEEAGLMLPQADRMKAARTGSVGGQILGFAGELAGLMTPFGAGAQIGKLGTKLVGKVSQATPKLLQGTRLGKSVTGGAMRNPLAVGAVTGGTEALMVGGIERGGQEVRGDESPRRDLMAETMFGAGLGGAGGLTAGLMSAGARATTESLRRGAGDMRARDLGAMRAHLGPGVSETQVLTGVTETPAMRDLSMRSLDPQDLGGAKVHQTPEQVGMRGLPRAARHHAAKRERAVLAKQAETNEAFYTKHEGERRYMTNAAKEMFEIARRREGVPFANDSVAQRAIHETTEFQAVNSIGDAAMHSDADGFIRAMSQNEAIEVYGRAAVEEAAQKIGAPKNFALVVKARQMNPRQYDEAMRGIDRQINYDSARQKDPLWKNLRTKVAQDRGGWSEDWSRTKARHHEELNDLEARQKAFGLGGPFRDTSEKDLAQIENMLKGAAGPEGSTDEFLFKVLSENPEMLRRFNAMRATGARGRLKQGYGGVPGSRAGLIRAAQQGGRTRIDPVMQMLQRRIGGGARAGILAPEELSRDSSNEQRRRQR